MGSKKKKQYPAEHLALRWMNIHGPDTMFMIGQVVFMVKRGFYRVRWYLRMQKKNRKLAKVKVIKE